VRRRLAVVSAYTAVTAALLWPQIGHLTSVPVHHDPVFSIWRLAWIAHQLPRHPLDVFNANIFYPEQRTLAYSDAILLPAVIGAPLIWIGVPAVVVYNLLVCGSFVAAGAAMFLLVSLLTRDTLAAWCAGLIFAFAPYRFDHYVHFELLWMFWMPLAFWALHRTFDSGDYRYGALTGLFAGCETLSSVYYGFFLTTSLVVVALSTLALSPRLPRRKVFLSLIAGAVCALILIAPYGVPYLENARILGDRSAAEIADYSAKPINFLASPRMNLVYGWTAARWGGNEKQLFVGVTAVLLALMALARPVKPATIAYCVLLLMAIDAALGFNGLTYSLLHRFVPWYRGLRVPARWGAVVVFAVAVLAGMGVANLSRLYARRARTRLAMGVVISGLLLCEYWTLPSPAERLPTVASPLYQWLAEQPRSVTLELPVPLTSELPGEEARYLYTSTFHWQPLVNGYSGHYPQSHMRLLDAMRTFPDLASLSYLQSVKVRLVIVHPQLMGLEKYFDLEVAMRRFPTLHLVGHYLDGLDRASVYELRPL
jgi:hypothetical protein